MRLGIVGLVFLALFRGRRRPHYCDELLRLLTHDKRAGVHIPRHVRAADCGGPLQLKIAHEARFDFERLLGFHIEQDDRARFFHRDKKGFAHGERVAAVDDGARFRPNNDRARQRFRWNDAIALVKSQMEFAQKLQRIDPRFHASGFVPEQSRARSDYRQKLPRPHGSR